MRSMAPRSRARIAGTWAAIYFAALPMALLTLPLKGAFYAYVGAALVVAMFVALADMGLPQRLAIATGLTLYLLMLMGAALNAPYHSPEHLQDLRYVTTWFWTATICNLVGLLLPIRMYVGALGWPRPKPSTRPSVANLLGIVAYFGLVALPLSPGVFQGIRNGVLVATIALATSVGPLLALLGARPGLRVAGVALELLGIALFLQGTNDLSMVALVPMMATPLAASILAWWAGLRLQTPGSSCPGPPALLAPKTGGVTKATARRVLLTVSIVPLFLSPAMAVLNRDRPWTAALWGMIFVTGLPMLFHALRLIRTKDSDTA